MLIGEPVHRVKLSTKDRTTRCHPSTITKSKSLKGSEIIIGGIIIIPIDINVAETKKSITKNGTKIKKPI
jgi:hypothetical protein